MKTSAIIKALPMQKTAMTKRLAALEEEYFMEIDELGDTEDEPQWLQELGARIGTLKGDIEKPGQSVDSTLAVHRMAQLDRMLANVIKFLAAHANRQEAA